MTRLALVALLLSGPDAHGADWPRWRGPNGTGTADGTLPDEPDLLWKVELPGKGSGSPIVASGRVYLQAAAMDGATRTLVCLNAADGKTAWATAHDAEKASFHPKGGLGANTPAADGTAVYCVWWDGPTAGLRAYDQATGAERWSVPLGKQTSVHGAHHSPAVHGGMVFVNLDQEGGAELLAFDAKTGKKAWSADRPAHRASYTTPMLFEAPGGATELVVGSTAGIDSYDPKTGTVNWHYAITWPKGNQPLRMIGSPLLAQGLLVTQMGDGGGSRYTLAIKPGGTGGVTAAKAWERKKDAPYLPGMVAKGEHLYWIDDRGVATCAEAKTGKTVWAERVFEGDMTASPALVGNKVLAVSDKGKVAVLKAAKEFAEPETWEVGERVLASPAVAGGRVYVRGAAHMFCYGKK